MLISSEIVDNVVLNVHLRTVEEDAKAPKIKGQDDTRCCLELFPKVTAIMGMNASDHDHVSRLKGGYGVRRIAVSEGSRR